MDAVAMEEAQRLRRNAEASSATEYSWPSQRAALFERLASFAKESGLHDEAHAARWDWLLWSSVIEDRTTRRSKGHYFDVSLWRDKLTADSSATGDVEEGEEEVSRALGYIERRLTDASRSPVARAAYADVLYELPQRRLAKLDYARTAVRAYLTVARELIQDPSRIVVVSDLLFRAATIAGEMQRGTNLADEVRKELLDMIDQLRAAGRLRDLAELVPAVRGGTRPSNSRSGH